jgi:tetratricopeptide (TPR) repeat protein
MKNLLCRLGVFGATAVMIVALSGVLRAETTPASATTKPATSEELSQPELLKSYLQLKEQLQATQLAIATSRIEAEVAARAQAATLTEKLDAIKAALEAERERHRSESDRIQSQLLESQHAQAEMQRSNRTVLWIATAFGAVVMLAMFLMPLFQWRAINRLAEIATARPQLAGPEQPAGLLGGENPVLPEGRIVSANQRMQSVIERLERRVYELEHTAAPSATSAPASAAMVQVATVIPAKAETATRIMSGEDQDNADRIKLFLGKGRALLAADKPKDALSCFNEVLKLDLNHPEALVKRGAALERLKQDEEAIQCYDRAIQADGKMTLAYLYKGGVCNRLERYEEAMKCYEQALRTEDESHATAVQPAVAVHT